MRITFSTRVEGETLDEVTAQVAEALDAFFGEERPEMPGDLDIQLVRTVHGQVAGTARRIYECYVSVSVE